MQLELVKKEMFGEVNLDIYSKGGSEEIYMTAKQLGEALEYKHAQRSIDKFVEKYPYLEENELSVKTELVSTDGKTYNTRVFTEDGIYEVTMLSKQPKAREFRKFIREMLKGLRKGELIIQSANTPVPSYTIVDEIDRARRWIEEAEETRRLELKVEELKPEADYARKVLSSKDTEYNATFFAKEYGVSAVTFNKVLQEMGVHYKSNGNWLLYAKYQNKEYKSSKTIELKSGRIVTEVFWTEKGRKFIYELFKEYHLFRLGEEDSERTPQRMKAIIKNGFGAYMKTHKKFLSEKDTKRLE